MKSATLTINDAFFRKYRKSYNTLIDVEDAYEKLKKKKDHLRIIREGLKIIRDNKANEFAGLLLLHRHFNCKAKTLFIERIYTPKQKDHRTLFITTPEPEKKLPKRFAPWRFSVNKGGELFPLEFTTDPKVITGYRKLAANKQLLSEIGKFIHRYKLDDIIGLGIYDRTKLIYNTTKVFVEETDFENLASITQLMPHTAPANERRIPTLWTIRLHGTINGCCTYNCSSYCSHSDPLRGYCGHRRVNHVGCV